MEDYMRLGMINMQLYFNSLYNTTVALNQPSSLLEIIMTFPFNLILLTAALVVIGAVLSLSQKQTVPEAKEISDLESPPPQEFDEEIPRRFNDHRDGVIKLYDWFYRFAQIRLGAIKDNMTPREFQRVIKNNVPSDGASALEILVTNYEIAVYSAQGPTKEIFDNSLRSVGLLKKLIQSRYGDKEEHA
jgi:hypothetical protein